LFWTDHRGLVEAWAISVEPVPFALIADTTGCKLQAGYEVPTEARLRKTFGVVGR